jgi:hypothetical protein
MGGKLYLIDLNGKVVKEIEMRREEDFERRGTANKGNPSGKDNDNDKK